ncbi:hypothetical protein SS50377_27118 [Spironucleus salmonicida]|uniref:Uncharacterized protein n=1 Tax=Spironucleus salmonicida TaxID=348837 RepID=V6LSK2_9EUKA|nr:hypothetical protein SS50377_27118 [Spironucleus salmonicida]|eukprot:EST43754.1 Hypothetical protein SS50377_16489 [Spironucleus salmonicida]
MSLPLKLFFQDGQHLLVPVDPLSTFYDIQLMLPKLISISMLEAQTLSFHSQQDIIYSLTQRITQIQQVFIKVLFPLFTGVSSVNESEHLRKKHLVGCNFVPISDSYQKLLIQSAIYKLAIGHLLTETELSGKAYHNLLVIRFHRLLKESFSCPEDVQFFVRHSQLNRQFSTDFGNLFTALKRLQEEQFDLQQLQKSTILELSYLHRFPEFLTPAVELTCYNNNEVVRQISGKYRYCYIGVGVENFSILDHESLLGLEVPLEMTDFVSLRYYSDCIVFEFKNAGFFTFSVNAPDSFYTEFVQYMDIVQKVKNNMK